MSYPQWVYHPEKEAHIVDSEDAKKMFATGWYSTPADFPQKGEATGNGDIDLSDMSKADLLEFAKFSHDVDLDKRKSKANLIKDIEALNDSSGTD